MQNDSEPHKKTGTTDSQAPASASYFQALVENQHPEKLKDLEAQLEIKRKCIAAHEVIYLKKQHIKHIFIIRNGLIKLFNELGDGKSRTVRLHSRGSVIGFEGLLGSEYKHTAVALTKAEVDVVPLSNLLTLVNDNPREYFYCLKILFEQLSNSDRWIAEFSTGSIRTRLAHFINYLSILEFGNNQTFVRLLTVQETADILGITPESTSRVLAEFKRKKILSKSLRDFEEIYEIDMRKLFAECN